MDESTPLTGEMRSRLDADFYRNFLIHLAFVDGQGHFLHRRSNERYTFCGNEHADGECRICTEENFFAVNEALRFGNVYLMNAHTGLIFFALPVMVNQSVAGGIVSSRILPMELYTLITEEKRGYVNDEHIIRTVKQIPVIESGTVHTALDYLYTLALKYNLVNDAALMRARVANEQAAGMAEAIVATKVRPENYHMLYLYKEKDLVEKIKNGDRHAAVRILNDILVGIFSTSSTPVDVIKARLMELVVIISRAAVEAGVPSETLFRNNYRYFKEAAGLDNHVAITHWIVRVLEEYITEVAKKDTSVGDTRIAAALSHIHEHCREKLSLDDMASLVGLSTSHFAHEFKNAVGVSFVTYVNDLKLKRAVDMLMSADATVVEIAYDLGYSDQSYFIRQFKAKYRMTPLEYRKKYQRKRNVIN